MTCQNCQKLCEGMIYCTQCGSRMEPRVVDVEGIISKWDDETLRMDLAKWESGGGGIDS